MTHLALVGFFLAILPLVLTPGASFTLTTQVTLQGRRHGTAAVIAGTATGITTHAVLAAAGLSALVMRSSQAFTVVRVVGAGYLIGLGAWTLWSTRRRRASPATASATASARSAGSAASTSTTAPTPRRLPWTGHRTYPQAVLANVLNPKAASIYLTLAPQFLDAGHVGLAPILALAGVHIAAMGTWLTVWSMLLTRGRRWTTSTSVKNAIDRASAAVLIALGVRAATTA